MQVLQMVSTNTMRIVLGDVYLLWTLKPVLHIILSENNMNYNVNNNMK